MKGISGQHRPCATIVALCKRPRAQQNPPFYLGKRNGKTDYAALQPR